MKTLRYGIEIETIGQTRQTLAKAIQTVVGGTVTFLGDAYDSWAVLDATGRTWKVMSDSSLSASYDRQGEVVSPILTWNDLPTLEAIVRAVKAAGAKVDATCGIHVHVDAAAFDAKKLCNLAKLVHQQEDLIVAALGVQPARLARYTKKIDAGFIQRIVANPPKTMLELNHAWYGRSNASPRHYDESRYHGLNLHSVWYRGTIEFRYFEGSLDAYLVKANVQFCLALAAKALTARFALSRKRALVAEHLAYDFRVFLLRLGMIGPEFSDARAGLLSKAGGNSAWRNTRPAPRTPAATATAAPSAPTNGAER